MFDFLVIFSFFQTKHAVNQFMWRGVIGVWFETWKRTIHYWP